MDQNVTIQTEQARLSLISSTSNKLSELISSPVTTPEEALRLWGNVLEICAVPDDCWFGDYPTLKDLSERFSKGKALGFIASLLYMTNEATNYGTKLNGTQISMLSKMVFEKYSYLKTTELMMFFRWLFWCAQKDTFYGAIESETVIYLLTKFVREKRGNAIAQHEKALLNERLEREKVCSIDWKAYCAQKGIDLSESPIEKINSSFKSVSKDKPDSIIESAEGIINNKWGYDDDMMMNVRRSFVYRYGYTPEDYLRKEGKYV